MCGVNKVKAIIANNLFSTTSDGMRLVRSEKEKQAQESGDTAGIGDSCVKNTGRIEDPHARY